MLTLMSCLHLSSFNELSFTQTCLSQWYDKCSHMINISFFVLFGIFLNVFSSSKLWPAGPEASWPSLPPPPPRSRTALLPIKSYYIFYGNPAGPGITCSLPTLFYKNKKLPTPALKLYLAHLALHLLLQPLELPGPLLQAAPTPSTLPHDHKVIHMVIIAALKSLVIIVTILTSPPSPTVSLLLLLRSVSINSSTSNSFMLKIIV